MKTTANLGLKKPEGTDVVNIDDFNYNADIIDTELQKRALKTDIPTIPVQSVNGKTGTVSLTATDVGAATSAQGIKADTALQSSQLGQAGGPAKQDDFASHLADNLYQTAGGTATAITLTISGTLVTGYPVNFIASTNNNGAATTINGKPLYKPGTTTTPTLIANKAYTVWYNATSNCFFIKASAEGNTIPSHVLAGDIFSTDDIIGGIGTMPNYAGTAQNSTGTANDGGGNLWLNTPTGYYTIGSSIKAYDANYIASNIISGKSIFGLVGTATIQSLGGKRWASGTASLNGVQIIEVTGLSFLPSVVLVYSPTSSNQRMFYSSAFSTTTYAREDHSTNKYEIGNIPGASSLYVTNGGFKLQGFSGYNTTQNWIAIE